MSWPDIHRPSGDNEHSLRETAVVCCVISWVVWNLIEWCTNFLVSLVSDAVFAIYIERHYRPWINLFLESIKEAKNWCSNMPALTISPDIARETRGTRSLERHLRALRHIQLTLDAVWNVMVRYHQDRIKIMKETRVHWASVELFRQRFLYRFRELLADMWIDILSLIELAWNWNQAIDIYNADTTFEHAKLEWFPQLWNVPWDFGRFIQDYKSRLAHAIKTLENTLSQATTVPSQTWSPISVSFK